MRFGEILTIALLVGVITAAIFAAAAWVMTQQAADAVERAAQESPWSDEP